MHSDSIVAGIDAEIATTLMKLRELNDTRLTVLSGVEGLEFPENASPSAADWKENHASYTVPVIEDANEEKGMAAGWGENFFVFEPCDHSYSNFLYTEGTKTMPILGWLFSPVWVCIYLWCFLWACGECQAVKILVAPMWVVSGGNKALVELWQRQLLPCWMLDPIDRAGHERLVRRAKDYSSRGIGLFVFAVLGGIWVFLFIGLWMIFWVLASRLAMVVPLLFAWLFTGLNSPWTAFLCRTIYPPLIAPTYKMEAPQVLQGDCLC